MSGSWAIIEYTDAAASYYYYVTERSIDCDNACQEINWNHKNHELFYLDGRKELNFTV